MWISALLIGFGVPSFSLALSLAASLFGFVPLAISNRSYSFWPRFFRATLTCTIAYAIQLFWFLSHPFLYIYPVWPIFSLFLGMSIALPLAFLSKERLQSVAWCGISAFGIVCVEYARFYFFCGFSLYPIGFSLSGFSLSRLSLVYLGMSGLTFFIAFSQLLLTRFIMFRKGFLIFALTASIPYVSGSLSSYLPSRQIGTAAVAIIDTHDLPEMIDNPAPLIRSAQQQLKRLIRLTSSASKKKLDLVLAPEIHIPFSPWSLIFPTPVVTAEFQRNSYDVSFKREVVCVLEVLKELSRVTSCTIIIGLEGRDQNQSYNSAYCVYPKEHFFLRYDKQILVPLGEYIPFAFLEPLLKQYGVSGAFMHGEGPKLFPFQNLLLAPSICYEETFPDIIRLQKLEGANLLINLSNDNWFPTPRLAQDHFEHARAVSTSMGVPLVRACNMGLSAAVDEMGNELPLKEVDSIDDTKLLAAHVPIINRTTPFEVLGMEKSILVLFGLCLLIYGFEKWATSRERSSK